MGRERPIASSAPTLFLLGFLSFLVVLAPGAVRCQDGGAWDVIIQNAGISSMHTAVTRFGSVILLDRTDIGPSQLNFTSPSSCRDDPNDIALKHDCTAHSALLTPGRDANSTTLRPLSVLTDTWCSSGQFLADGTLVQTGGDLDGLFRVRRFAPCHGAPVDESCDWEEASDEYLQDGRWYASNQLLPDGRQIVVGGRGVFTYEFLPAYNVPKLFLPLLLQSNDAQGDNLYPFLHLLPDGNLFIFANRDSIIFDYHTGATVRQLPTLAGEPRNYPSAGSSVMLPLDAANGFSVVEILVCGGAQFGSFLYPVAFMPASETCGRIDLSVAEPIWEMETMPFRRTMGDMVLLPDGDVLIINGAQEGCQGWGYARNATLNPLRYEAGADRGQRFSVLAATTIPRVYHSTANLLPDGRVLVAGSNAHQFYTFTGEFPTELRIEAFSPGYLSPANDMLRPAIRQAPEGLEYSSQFSLILSAPTRLADAPNLHLNLLSSPFTTHSFSMGQRLLRLQVLSRTDLGSNLYLVNATSPPSPNVAPPSYYMLFVINQGIPSSAVWVHVHA